MTWLDYIRKYKQVPISETSSQSEELLSSSNEYETDAKIALDEDEIRYDQRLSNRHRGRRPDYTFAHCCSCLTFVLGVTMIVASFLRKPTDSECIKRLTVWSPLVEIAEMEEVNFENKLRHKTEFRGPPTPDIEAAWKRISHFAGVNIPVSKLPLYNKSDSVEWQLTPPEQGGGLFAGIEVFHQVHCLNVIRKFTWLDHYEGIPIGFSNDPEDVRTHVDHCLETLRLSLMCNADLTPYFLERDPSIPGLGGRNDFNVHHKCKKWDGITDWMHGNAINGKLLVDNERRPDYTIIDDEGKHILSGA